MFYVISNRAASYREIFPNFLSNTRNASQTYAAELTKVRGKLPK